VEFVGQVIKRKRLALKLTQEDLEERTGFTQSYISQVERGETRQPSRERLRAFADALNLDYNELLRIADYAPEYAGDPRKGVDAGEERTYRTKAKVPADAARWAVMLDEYEGRDVQVPVSWIASAAYPLFAVDVSGDCLESLHIVDGDIVILEEYHDQPIADGKVVLVQVDGGYTLKRWFQRDGGHAELRDGDDAIAYVLSEAVPFEVHGVFYRLVR
jgi:transcriptional regulator with XRE-family HTH domain